MGNKASSKDMLFLLRKNFLHFILMKTYLGFNEFNFSYDNNIGHVHSLLYVIYEDRFVQCIKAVITSLTGLIIAPFKF